MTGRRQSIPVPTVSAYVLSAVLVLGCGATQTASQPSGSNHDQLSTALHSQRARPLPELGYLGRRTVPAATIPRLTSADETEMIEVLRSLPLADGYLFSGCQNRAHALWTALPERLREGAVKLWLIAPQGYTFISDQGLGVNGFSEVDWDFHVALIYARSDGSIYALDPAMSHAGPVAIVDWLGRLTGLENAVGYVAPARYYGYFMSNAPDRSVMNGEFYEYTGASEQSEWLTRGLAVDDVGEMLLADGGISCSALDAREATAMGRILQQWSCAGAVPEETEATCSDVLRVYDASLVRWRSTLRLSEHPCE